MLWVLIASIVGGTLLLAGAPKVRDRQALLRTVRGYKLLPAPLEQAVSFALPWVEIVLGLALITGIAGRIAAACATALFACFFAGLSINLLRGRRDLDCGCFAFGSHDVPRIGWFHALRAGAFVLVSVGLAVVPTGDPSLGEHLLAVALAALVLAVVVAAVQLRSVVHPGRRPVDAHLTKASIELRAASTLSRY
ncbi:methylamine utilization protein [Rhodococcus sp. Z13]|uniref:Methylamine utilization protein n=1 Tax=Rhodococcus sacchari TaxID=2962047 RepID=A0ACD4DGJ2_9NOCA|nr:MauE/DoxX family redox-associated membrane protein [Rhodococcus sp. Z13]UYP19136.1 methylamine utilization protein [Rhodococcus sp. Z13]